MPLTGKAVWPVAAPRNGAPPTEKTPPSRAARRYPGPEATAPTIGWLRATPTLTLPGASVETAAGAAAGTAAGASSGTVAAAAGEADGRTASVPRTGGAAS